MTAAALLRLERVEVAYKRELRRAEQIAEKAQAARAQSIREIVEAGDLRQADVARALGISRARVGQIVGPR